MFGDLDYDPSYAYSGAVPLEEQLEALGEAVHQGKVGDTNVGAVLASQVSKSGDLVCWCIVCWAAAMDAG
jgi:aryl-alcohol dehydrogenase-like predicted oxidoreductase